MFGAGTKEKDEEEIGGRDIIALFSLQSLGPAASVLGRFNSLVTCIF